MGRCCCCWPEFVIFDWSNFGCCGWGWGIIYIGLVSCTCEFVLIILGPLAAAAAEEGNEFALILLTLNNDAFAFEFASLIDFSSTKEYGGNSSSWLILTMQEEGGDIKVVVELAGEDWAWFTVDDCDGAKEGEWAGVKIGEFEETTDEA